MKLLRKIAVLAVAAHSAGAWAYRPFDGTDADVADCGVLEVELGPVMWSHQGLENALVVPAWVLNYGLFPHWEVVFEGRNEIALGEAPFDRITNTGLFLKGIVREGALQGPGGLSVATELGVLLPTYRDEPGVGASGALILSYQWPALTLHVNGQLSLLRRHELGGFASIIAEGPRAWRVRPVAELAAEAAIGEPGAATALAGVLAPIGDHVVIDAAVRWGTNGVELRAGLTWAISFFEAPAVPEQEK